MRRLRAFLFRLSTYRIAVLVGVVITLVHVFGAMATGRVDTLPVLGRVESILYDFEFVERGVRQPPADVVVAAVDEKAIDTLGLFPWSRGDVAKLVTDLTALGARTIAFDVAFTDASYQEGDAEARKLASRFHQVSLSSPTSAELLTRLTSAKALAADAETAVQSLPAGSTAARDVRARLQPLSETLGSVTEALLQLQNQQSQLDSSLAAIGTARSPDDELADAIHQSGKVVLGSFLLLPQELQATSKDARKAALAAVSHMAMPLPTRGPVELSPDDVMDGLSDKATTVPLFMPGYTGVKAPLSKLIVKPDGHREPVAFFNVEPDEDGVVRRDPMVFLVGDEPDWDERTVLPSLDFGAILAAYDASPGSTRIWSSSESGLQIEQVAFVPHSAGHAVLTPKVKDFVRIPVDAGGRLLVNYYGPNGTMPHISLADVWNGKVPRDQVAGKVVLFGVTAIGTHDQRVTPFEKFAPGVDVHAAAIDNVLSGDYLRRPWWALVVEALVLMIVALGVGYVLTRVSVLGGLPVVLGTVLLWHVADLALFAHGFALFCFLPIGEVGSIYVFQTIYRYVKEERKARETRRAFQHYLSKSVMEEVLKDPSKLKLGGDKRVLSVMFSDIRGFTTISERLSPEQLARMINEYLTPMTNLVFDHGGTLDKYIGDALMAIWGAPNDQSDHALRCCQTAVAMLRELDKLQARWKAEGRDYPPIDIGIGINSGPMVVGNMGADQRFDYTVLGDNVNLASRLEGTNKEYRSHIIIAEPTRVMCGDGIAVRELGAVRVKGKREPVKIFELLDDKPASGATLEVITYFDEGVRLFRAQQWDDARARFRRVLELWHEDGPAQAYLEFCDESERNPPGEDWDGVYTMTHK